MRFELPEEFQKITRNIKANLLTDEEFSSAWLKTRKWLQDAALNHLKKGAAISSSLLEEAGEEYPLALAALQTIEAGKIASDDKLFVEEAIDRLSPMVEAGNYEAAYAAYILLARKASKAQASPYLNTAAKINPEAMIIAGNNNEGMRILSLLASQGLPSAANMLGKIYSEGIGVRKDAQIAARYFEVAKTGVPMSTAGAENEYPLAVAARQSEEVSKIMSDDRLSLEEAVYRLTPFAEAGNYTALYAIARKYEDDTENFGNQQRGVPYFTRAAIVHPEAMIRMGEIQEQGFYDVKANPKRAKAYYDEGIRILSLLASQGLPSAAAELGHVYIEGLGTKQDIPRATRYFEFARKAGYEHPELWLWEHYGVTMRQVLIPEKLREKTGIKYNSTCIYLVREKLYSYYWGYFSPRAGGFGTNELVNTSVLNVALKTKENWANKYYDNTSMRFGGQSADGEYTNKNFTYKPDNE